VVYVALQVLLCHGFVEPEAYFYDSFKAEYLVLIESIKSKAFNLAQEKW